jgi:hypothetical protein
LSERSLREYLLLPRPGDLVKAWIFPAVFVLGMLAAGGASGTEALRAAVLWIALELLIYQARYQWNDIRGFAADQRHPDRAARGRLPGPLSCGEAHIRASALVALGRLGLVAVLAVALPLDLGWTLAALVVAVFGVAVLYEVLRGHSTGDSDQVPPPLTGGILALWMVVGAGYAIRGIAGLGAGMDFDSLWLPLAATMALWAFGIAFVTGRWALEALAFARRDPSGGVSWSVSPDQAREHSLALARWLPTHVSAAAAEQGSDSLREWRALADDASLSAPWNATALVAAMAAAATGCLLAGPATLGEVALAAGAGGVCGALALASRLRGGPGLLLGACVLLGLGEVAGYSSPALTLVPWLLAVGAHLFFTAQSPRTLVHPLRSALSSVRGRASGRHRGPVPTPVARG